MRSREILREEMGDYRVVGKHVYGNLVECANEDLLRNPNGLKNIVRNAAKLGNMTLLDLKAWKIGQGVSVVAVILESHITIHTWPEYRYATVDVYSCGAHTDPQKAFDYIVASLRPKRVEIGKASRSLE
ncbi:MAG: adenosylmethionine decarboxylase [Desulfurococcales archaeon]|nr:adenosylmethionine decarboxylase [Desulfurococcales archaeon]